MIDIYEPLVSIITVVYNGATTIEQTIQSVINQTYENIEYIIIDGASTDGTQDIIDQYRNHISCFISEKDDGIYDAMNKGILRANGDIIGIINSDDWYESDAVKEVVGCFGSTGADVVYGEIWTIGPDGQWESCTCHSVFPPHPSTFIRHSVYDQYGLFDTRYRIAADRELLLRFMSAGAVFERMDKILADFRSTGISNVKKFKCARESYEINLKYLGKCDEGILNKGDIEESYHRSCMIYVSQMKPQAIREVLCGKCNETDGVIIFGAGTCGKELGEILQACNIPIAFFTDNDEQKWGSEVGGIQIYSPEVLRYCKGFVIVTVTRYQKDICSQIRSYANPALEWSVLEEIRQSIIRGFDISFWECD